MKGASIKRTKHIMESKKRKILKILLVNRQASALSLGKYSENKGRKMETIPPVIRSF